MNTDDIRQYCLTFAGATEKLQWGDALCFKVRDKMFAVLGLDNLRLTFKSTAEGFSELIEREHFQPSPYVGRYHWVLLERLDAVGENELKDLIRRSYELVEAKAPKSKGGRTSGVKRGRKPPSERRKGAAVRRKSSKKR